MILVKLGREAEQVGVACRPVRLAVPELEQQRALQKELGVCSEIDSR